MPTTLQQQLQNSGYRGPFQDSGISSRDILSSLGVDTSTVKQDIDNDIQGKKNKIFTQEQFKSKFNNARLDPKLKDMSDDDIINQLLKSAKSKGYTIEGVDIDQEIQSYSIPSDPETRPSKIEIQSQSGESQQQEKSSFLLNKVKDFGKSSMNTLTSFGRGVENTVGGAISNVPEAISNTGAFFIGKPVDYGIEKLGFDLPSLEQQFKDDGLETKEAFQEALGVDPDAFMTSVGEFGSDVGLLFVPGGQAKLASKFPNLTEKIGKLSTTLDDMAKNAPKAYQKIKSVATSKVGNLAKQGAVETAKFDIVSEGDISATSVATGAIANPLIDKTGKVVKNIAKSDSVNNMMKVFKPTKKKGQTAKAVKTDMAVITESLKNYQKKPQNIEDLYTDLVDIQKGLYSSKINPALQKATESGGKIKTSSIVDEILPTIGENKSVQGKTLSSLFGRGKEAKQLESVAEQIRKMGDIDFLEAETLKQYTSALAISANQNKGMLSSLQEDFVQKLNKKLGDTMDDMIEKISGEGIKQFKTEYGAIARHLDALNRRIINESKMSGDSLFSGLGKISGIRDIVTGNVTQGLSTIFTGEILKMMKDPDEILKRVIKDIYRDQAPGVIKPKIIGGGSSEVGNYLDENQ